MSNPKIKFLLVSSVLVSFLVLPMAAFAQDVPASTVTPSAINQAQNFDWRWLLPLLLIPLLFMFRRSDNNRDYPQTGAGTKGGRVDTMDDSDDDDTVETRNTQSM
jgi:hypothetical protein